MIPVGAARHWKWLINIAGSSLFFFFLQLEYTNKEKPHDRLSTQSKTYRTSLQHPDSAYNIQICLTTTPPPLSPTWTLPLVQSSLVLAASPATLKIRYAKPFTRARSIYIVFQSRAYSPNPHMCPALTSSPYHHKRIEAATAASAQLLVYLC